MCVSIGLMSQQMTRALSSTWHFSVFCSFCFCSEGILYKENCLLTLSMTLV